MVVVVVVGRGVWGGGRGIEGIEGCLGGGRRGSEHIGSKKIKRVI